MTMIDQRPDEAADRKVGGHWEGDLITGEDNRCAIGTLVERTSRYTILRYLPGRHTADAIRDAVIDAMNDLPAQLRLSLTWDQGSEMAWRDRRGVGQAGVHNHDADRLAAVADAPNTRPGLGRPASAAPDRMMAWHRCADAAPSRHQGHRGSSSSPAWLTRCCAS
jgi:hypothetical protein